VDVEDRVRPLVALRVGRAGDVTLVVIRRIAAPAGVIMMIAVVVLGECIVVKLEGVRSVRRVHLMGVRRRRRHDAEMRQGKR
jgi:hypothetical protein